MAGTSSEKGVAIPTILYGQKSHLLVGIAMAGGRAVYNPFPGKLSQVSRVCLMSAIRDLPKPRIAKQAGVAEYAVTGKIAAAFRIKGELAPTSRRRLLTGSLASGIVAITQKGTPDDFLLDPELLAFLAKETGNDKSPSNVTRRNALGQIREKHPNIESLGDAALAATLSGQLGDYPVIRNIQRDEPYVADSVTGLPTANPPDNLPLAALVPDDWIPVEEEPFS